MSNFGESSFGPLRLDNIVLNRIGLGTNRVADTGEARDFLKQAVEAGVNFIDTAHAYGGGASETAIGNALAPFPDNLVVATKGGMRDGGGGGDNRPDFLRANLETSLRRLKTGCITLYQLHRVDDNVPLGQTIELLKSFQTEGKIKHIGLSEVGVEQIEEARRHAEIVSVQNQYSLTYREHEEVLDYCAQNGIIFIPWFPLRDINGDPALLAKLKPIADKYDANPQQLVLAWLLKKSSVMLPIPGTLSIGHLRDNLAAAQIELSAEDFRQLDNF